MPKVQKKEGGDQKGAAEGRNIYLEKESPAQPNKVGKMAAGCANWEVRLKGREKGLRCLTLKKKDRSKCLNEKGTRPRQ